MFRSTQTRNIKRHDMNFNQKKNRAIGARKTREHYFKQSNLFQRESINAFINGTHPKLAHDILHLYYTGTCSKNGYVKTTVSSKMSSS